MAIYSLNHKPIGRSTHQPGTASAHIQYITRYRAASEVVAEHMPADPGPAMKWMDEQEVSSRKNARLVDKVMVALPRELDAVQRSELVRDFAAAVTKGRVPWIAAIHDMGKDAQNPHAHFAFRDRDHDTGKRVLRLSDSERDRKKAGLAPNGTEWLRTVWETCANQALERAGRSERIDRRSLEAQGIERDPGVHIGPKANELARKDQVPPSRVANDENGREIRWPEIDRGKSRVEHNRAIQARNRLKGVKLDRFKQDVGKAWEALTKRQTQEAREDERRLKAAEERERLNLNKRQAHRAAEEAAQDERRRPKGVSGFFARLTGRAKRIEKEITTAKQRRALRDRGEWKALDDRQAAHRQEQAASRAARFEDEKRLFRAEARRMHERISSEGARGRETRSTDREREPGSRRRDKGRERERKPRPKPES
ncbi:MAG: MobA/MobL family protein [Erythrobacter sp.]|nr:MobA/MobL family protein [Erythrobacter sp.]